MPTFARKQNHPKKQVSSSLAPANTASSGPMHDANAITHLQRAFSEQARKHIPQPHTEELEAELSPRISPQFGHDFRQIPLYPPAVPGILAEPASTLENEYEQRAAPREENWFDLISKPMAPDLQSHFAGLPATMPLIQCKPTVGSPGDAYEREADEVADRMMRMAEPPSTTVPAAIQYPSAAGEGEEKNTIQAMRTPSPNAETTPNGEAVAHTADRGGAPLPQDVRSYFEPRFGHDFRAVRVHADGEAADRAGAVQARAYTIGHNIVFGPGEYAPATVEGKRLLAHELVHVVQQDADDATRGASTVRRQEHQGAPEKRRTDPVSSAQLHSAPVALQRKASTDDVKRAEAEHRAIQQSVYKLLEPDTRWDYIRRGDPLPSTLTPEQQAKDPHVIFNNSVAWIRSQRISLSVLTPIPGQSETAQTITLFDPSILYPDLGGSVDNTVIFEKDVDAKTNDQSMQLVVKPGFTGARLRELLRHEVQHVADAHTEPEASKQAQAEFQAEQPTSGQPHGLMNATIWNQYQTEFRAYWLESITRPDIVVGVREDGTPVAQGGSGGVDKFGSEAGSGGELKVAGHDYLKSNPLYVPEAAIQLQNEKQTNIARLIVRKYFGMEETFLTSPLFRSKIQSLARPEGINLVNSLRIERLHHAMHGPATRKSLWLHTVTREEDLANAVRDLNDTDLAFLKDGNASRLFWDDARRQLNPAFFTWMNDYILQGKRDTPPPIPQDKGNASTTAD